MIQSPTFKLTTLLLAGALMVSGCQKTTDSDTTANDSATPATDTQHDDHDTEHMEGEHEAHDEHADHDSHDEHAGHEDHENHEGHEGHEGHDGHDGHDHSAMNMTHYHCTPEQEIQAHYEEGTGSAHLLIDGIEYDMTALKSTLATGNTNTIVYETDIGIDDKAGMMWQVNGDQAKLVNKTLDGSVPPEQEAVLFECQKS